jgi:hypothetical protein
MDASTAEKLVHSFRQRDDVSFVNITFHKDHGLLLVTNKEREECKNFSSEDLQKLYSHNQPKLGDDGWLQVMFVFAAEEEIRLVRMHPEFIACGTTSGTNKKIKELFTVALKDGNNRAFCGARAYIPNPQPCVFDLLFSKALPALWSKNVVGRVNLIVTNGCLQLRAAVARNIGVVRYGVAFHWLLLLNNVLGVSHLFQFSSQGKTFHRAILSTCYSHLAVIGFNSAVSKRATEQDQKPALDIIKLWIKSWFFDVETELEYQYSRKAFNDWLKLQRESGTLSSHTIDTLENWLTESIFGQDQYWANHDRLFVGGMECRTTSIVNPMHSSLKCGYDKVLHQTNSPEATAHNCVNHGKRKADELSTFNAKQVQRTRTCTNSKTHRHLTGYAEDFAHEQGEAAKQMKVVQRSECVFHVFRPDDEDSIRKAQKTPIPTFYRIRTVEISLCGKYAWCSCGFGDRYKAVCGHIIRVMGERHPQMYGVRWSRYYQHFFERKGWEKFTDIFRKMVLAEWRRDPKRKEQILVEGLTIPEVTSSEGDIELADRLIFWNHKKCHLRVRGQTVPPPTDENNDDK